MKQDPAAITLVQQARCFDGYWQTYQHPSTTNQCTMRFAVYLPPQSLSGAKLPVLYWLSGLTCTEENFMTKAGAAQYAALHGIILVVPDTSPRGEQVPDDPQGAWDFGLGAGFYLNATEPPWQQHYQMYDYIVTELPAIINQHFVIDEQRLSIFGHSMGGHGALVIALRHADRYRSVSAFAPIVAPSQCPWGEKAFRGYLGADRQSWLNYDACHLIEHPPSAAAHRLPLLIDVGLADPFIDQQLKPQLLRAACEKMGHPLTINERRDHDHSYFFIASFIGEHIQYHAQMLKA